MSLCKNIPDSVEQFDNGFIETYKLNNYTISKACFYPGWSFTKDIKHIVNTDLCEKSHVGYCLQGQMKLTMRDGTAFMIKKGDFVEIEPGHDAEIIGDEMCQVLDFLGPLSFIPTEIQ